MTDNRSMTVNRDARSRAIPRWLHILWFVPLGIAAYFHYRFISVERGFPIDDAYIYYRYIENLAAGHGFCFTPGEASFGVTSFLYPIISAIIYWITRPFGGDIYLAMQSVGLFGRLALTYIAQRLLYRQTGDAGISLFAGLLLGSCFVLNFTSPAGLETTLFLAVALGTIYLLLRKPATPSIYFGAACGVLFLIRPEGLVIPVSVAGFYILHTALFWNRGACETLRRNSTDLGAMGIGFFLTSLPYLLFIRFHTDSWLPATYYGKLLFENHFLDWSIQARLKQGFYSLLDGYRQILEQDTTSLSFIALIALSFAGGVRFVFRCGQHPPSLRVMAAAGTFFAFLVFPFLYGALFHIHPQFGGYFIRYIQITVVTIHIAGLLSLYLLLKSLLSRLDQPKRQFAITALVVLIAAPWYTIVAREALARLPADLAFYQINAGPKMQLRKQAGVWLREHTPTDSRVLLGRTGLGVIGNYCQRVCFDERGLINPDIFPYLEQDRMGFHWPKMLEYMKKNRIEYYATLTGMGENTPETHPTRFTALAISIKDPLLLNSPQHRYSGELLIFRYRWQERYELWDDLPLHSTIVERIHNDEGTHERPVDGRAYREFWDEQAVICLPTGANPIDLRFDLMMPSEARLRAGIAARLPQGEFAPDERIGYKVAIEYENQRAELYHQEIDLNRFAQDAAGALLDVDLSDWSDLYATLVLSVYSNSPRAEEIVAGWIRPRVINSSRIEME